MVSMTTDAILFPSGDQAKLLTPPRASVSFHASPPSSGSTQTCGRGAASPAAGRAVMNASDRPSGDHAGDDSPRSPNVS
jgi:hypothetical protein